MFSSKEKFLLVSVDLDDLWTIQEILRNESDRYSILEEAVYNALELFDQFSIKATFFCVAKDETILRNVLKEITKGGHEVANHSFAHQPNDTLSFEEKKQDIILSTKILEDMVCSKILGYRSPRWGCNLDVIRILEEMEYLYDASLAISPLFPILRCYLSSITKKKSYIFGNLKENMGFRPKTNLFLIPSTSIMLFPFYGTFHLYAPLGSTIFVIQNLFLPKTISYIFHAHDFVCVDGINVLKKKSCHWNFMKKILESISYGRKCITMAEYVNIMR